MLCLKRKSSNLQRLFPPFFTASAICNQRWRLKLCSLVILHPHDFHLSLCNFVMMFFSFSHFQAGWNQSIETKLRYSGAQKNIFYIPLLLVLRGGEVMAVVIPVGRYVPQIGLRSATRTYNRGQKLQTENLDPAHHQIKDGKIFLAFVWLHPWLRNEVMGVGFSVPFFSVQDCSWMFLSSGILIL